MGFECISQHVHPEHPPNEEYRDDGPCDVNCPVARCFRFPKIEHAAMVAGPRTWRNFADSLILALFLADQRPVDSRPGKTAREMVSAGAI
jgi:hypothetical protein